MYIAKERRSIKKTINIMLEAIYIHINLYYYTHINLYVCNNIIGLIVVLNVPRRFNNVTATFSTKKRFNSAARISKCRNTRSCLTSLHNGIRKATRIVSSYVEMGDYLSDLDATRIICGSFPRRYMTILHSLAMIQL